MTFRAEVDTPDTSEVQSVHWLTFDEARQRLTYDTERKILEQLFRLAKGGER
ncbi:MAG: hypothetical protein WD995_12815 [Gemmatimonadota bacterium]